MLSGIRADPDRMMLKCGSGAGKLSAALVGPGGPTGAIGCAVVSFQYQVRVPQAT